MRAKYRKLTGFKYQFSKKTNEKQNIFIENSILQHENWLSGNEFQFLNEKYDFATAINWNFSDFGKLWTYNLCYFEFLEQKTMPKADGLRLIQDFIQKINTIKAGTEPFPTALRLMYWTKFLIKNEICDIAIDESFLAQAHILADNLEYHILGNHLLEDGFGLLMAAYYFQDDYLYEKASNILESELHEQILADGAHFELSPMYHQHILFRVLDAINIVKENNFYKNAELLPLLTEKAEIMLGWLTQMTFRNGDIPMLNDSAPDIAPTSAQLFAYAKQLNIAKKIVPLCESGYRKYENDRLAVIYDIGNVAPDYIPGHAHSDTFNFVVNIDNQPFIVDRGISTYEANAVRQSERGTAAHNTVMVAGQEQTEVWGGFRVAKRAKISFLTERNDHITAEHDGYKALNNTHRRVFKFTDKPFITIEDAVYTNDNMDCLTNNWQSFIHLHPAVKILTVVEEEIDGFFYTTYETNKGNILFSQQKCFAKTNIAEYDFCDGFNRTQKAKKIIINGVDDVVFTEIEPLL